MKFCFSIIVKKYQMYVVAQNKPGKSYNESIGLYAAVDSLLGPAPIHLVAQAEAGACYERIPGHLTELYPVF
jgi:hypothetical protein